MNQDNSDCKRKLSFSEENCLDSKFANLKGCSLNEYPLFLASLRSMMSVYESDGADVSEHEIRLDNYNNSVEKKGTCRNFESGLKLKEYIDSRHGYPNIKN